MLRELQSRWEMPAGDAVDDAHIHVFNSYSGFNYRLSFIQLFSPRKAGCWAMDSRSFAEVLSRLKRRYKLTRPLHIQPSDPFATLIGTILSHRTRDEKTDAAFSKLFKHYKTPEELALADVRSIERLIRDVGFYRQKARRIKKVAQIIAFELGGKVPREREELMQLPSVGPKTADIVLSFAYGEPEIAVDTHVETVAKRLGVAPEDGDYETVKKSLEELTPLEDRPLINTLFVLFGKEICRKPRPRCSICPVSEFCAWYRRNRPD